MYAAALDRGRRSLFYIQRTQVATREVMVSMRLHRSLERSRTNEVRTFSDDESPEIRRFSVLERTRGPEKTEKRQRCEKEQRAVSSARERQRKRRVSLHEVLKYGNLLPPPPPPPPFSTFEDRNAPTRMSQDGGADFVVMPKIPLRRCHDGLIEYHHTRAITISFTHGGGALAR